MDLRTRINIEINKLILANIGRHYEFVREGKTRTLPGDFIPVLLKELNKDIQYIVKECIEKDKIERKLINRIRRFIKHGSNKKT